jgi:phosphate-selective porin OprO/OprP
VQRAATAPNVRRRRIPQSQIQQLQRQIEENKAAASAARAAGARSEAAQSAAAESAAAAQAAASKGGGEKEKDDLDLMVKWKGAPELSSKDGKFRMKVRGRIETDCLVTMPRLSIRVQCAAIRTLG